MQSIWSDSVKNSNINNQKKLNGDIKTDVLIIGGGLAGVLCAYKLQEERIDYILVEAKTIGNGVTANTTAKITAQHGLIYSDIIKKYGVNRAKKYYEVNIKALKEYKKLSKKIPCDFEEKTAYLYSLDKPKRLEKEIKAYKKIGIPYILEKNPPLPFKTVGALGMENQAQFNPLKFILGIAKELNIYENTYINEIKDNTAFTSKGSITAKKIILTTHFPFINIPGLYFMKMHQHRSYVVAYQNAKNVDGMYIDERKDGYSFRNYNDYLLIGGGGHKTGKKGGNYTEIRSLAKIVYPKAEEKYNWATQDCITLDSIPYIGIHRKSAPNLYIATGFNKWGMTGTMAAAAVLKDLIINEKSKYEKLFSPQRSIWHPRLFANIISSTIGLLTIGKRCPHLGCALQWNRAERSWDCPCHGSRFDKKGNLIQNPAKRGISIE